MKSITIRFYEELNDFLPQNKKRKSYDVNFQGRQTVKDIIESQGVPHVEVDLVLVNGESVKFQYLVSDKDRIAVYPEFESLDISSVTKLRSKPLRDPRFILDVHLGKLAGYLRVLGFDSLYQNDYTDDEIINVSKQEKRIILTRDIGILKRNTVERGYWIRNTEVQEQALEVVTRFDLRNKIMPFKRCMECNGEIIMVSKDSITGLLEPKTKAYYNEFYRCMNCQKIYWKGSHYKKLDQFISGIIKKSAI